MLNFSLSDFTWSNADVHTVTGRTKLLKGSTSPAAGFGETYYCSCFQMKELFRLKAQNSDLSPRFQVKTQNFHFPLSVSSHDAGAQSHWKCNFMKIA